MKKSRGFVLCEETALAEAAVQLMKAQKLAKKRNRPEELVMVAAAWMELSARLGPEQSQEEDVKQFGFIGVEVKSDSPESEDEPGLHPEHGKF